MSGLYTMGGALIGYGMAMLSTTPWPYGVCIFVGLILIGVADSCFLIFFVRNYRLSCLLHSVFYPCIYSKSDRSISCLVFG